MQTWEEGINNRDNVFGNPHTLVLISIGLSRGTKQRNTEDISMAGKPVLRFREDGDAVTELAQVRELG